MLAKSFILLYNVYNIRVLPCSKQVFFASNVLAIFVVIVMLLWILLLFALCLRNFEIFYYLFIVNYLSGTCNSM